jgi:hypothetical protein
MLLGINICKHALKRKLQGIFQCTTHTGYFQNALIF